MDVSEVMEQVEELLDLSITAGEFAITESHSQLIDLSQIDFEALKTKFASTDYQRTETEKLKTAIAQKLQQMVRLNKTRMDYLEKFQQMIAERNADSRNVQMFFNDLINFAQELGTEDKRAIAHNTGKYSCRLTDYLSLSQIDVIERENLISYGFQLLM